MAAFTESDRLIASAKLWLARTYLTDLTEYRNGDENRFGRMVGSHGESYGNPARWVENLGRVLAHPATIHFYPNEIETITKALTALGYQLPNPQGKENA